MIKKSTLVIIILLGVAGSAFSQPFTKKYIMSFHTCGANCSGYTDHVVKLAESDDGTNWTLVPNFTPYKASVPDVIIRGSKLYIYTPGQVKRYNNTTNSWDSSTSQVSITDENGAAVRYVDPSAIVDSNGKIVLFYLNSTSVPMGQDPAGCSSYPCVKYFDSATEVSGSDGTQFVQNTGHRVAINVESGSASDPDIYYDGTQYILYVSRGSNTYAYSSATMHGSYNAVSGLPSGLLTTQGGIPCGFYNSATNKYWTYVHANVSGNTVIRQGIQSSLGSQLNTFNTVISGTLIGESSTTTTESPGFCENTFLNTTDIYLPEKEQAFTIQTNRNNNELKIHLFDTDINDASIRIFNTEGKEVYHSSFDANDTVFQLNNVTLNKGIYFLQLRTGNKVYSGKFIY